MKEKIKRLFIDTLKNSKNDLIDKEDILRLGEEYGLTFAKRVSKSKVVDTIIEKGYFDRLFEVFQEFIYIPIWQVADYYNMNSDQVEALNKLGIIKEEYKEEEYYNRKYREYYKAKKYPLSVLNYNINELKESYEKAYNTKNGFKFRIDTENKEQVEELVKLLSGTFEICNGVEIYEKRNNGFYSYLTVKKLNNSNEEEKRLTYTIVELKEEILKVKKEKEKCLADMMKRYSEIFGTSSIFELERIKAKYDEFERK